jgi:sec-independent protein translocase protein TatA
MDTFLIGSNDLHEGLGMFTGMPGWPELLLILFVVLLLFGSRRLPDLAHALGKSLSEFRKGRQEGAREEKPAVAENQANEQDGPDTETPG